MQAQKQGQIDNLVLKADGILLIYITSIRDISGTREKGISLDYRLVSTRVDEATGVSSQVLFAGSGEVNAVLGENGNVQIERNGVDKIADYIRDRFPNPDNTNYKIIAKRDNMITVNAGKKNNITTGMTGYVINAEKTSEGTQRISFRALFEVREVFNDSFNALLLNDVEEDNIIIPTTDDRSGRNRQ